MYQGWGELVYHCNDISFRSGKGYLLTGLEEMLIQKIDQWHWWINGMISINIAKGHFGEAHMSQLISLVLLSCWKSHKIRLLCIQCVLDLTQSGTQVRFSFFCGVDFFLSLWEPSSERIMQTKQTTWKGKQEGNLTNAPKPPLWYGLIFVALAGLAFRSTPAY